MSQKYIKSQNKNSHNAKSYGKYYATAGKECPGYKYVAKEYADLQPK